MTNNVEAIPYQMDKGMIKAQISKTLLIPELTIWY